MNYTSKVDRLAHRKFQAIDKIYQFTWQGYLTIFCAALLAQWIMEVPDFSARTFILALTLLLFYLCIVIVKESADWCRASTYSRLTLFSSEREFVLVIGSDLAKVIYFETVEQHYYDRELMYHYTRVKKVQRVHKINYVPFESRFVFVRISPGSNAIDLSLGMQRQQDNFFKLAEGARAILIQPGPPEGLYKDHTVIVLSEFKEKCVVAIPKPREGELSFDMKLFKDWVFGLAGVPAPSGYGFFAFAQEQEGWFDSVEKAVESRRPSGFELGEFLHQNRDTFLPKTFFRTMLKRFNAYMIILYLISIFALFAVLALLFAPVALIAFFMTALKIVGLVALFLCGVSLIDWEGFVEDLPILLVGLSSIMLFSVLTDSC